MTRIDFYIHVPDKLAYSCRLLRKVYLSGARVAVIAEPAFLRALDDELWQFSPVEFVPHCRAGASSASLAASPIVLTQSLTAHACANRPVLLNLADNIPVGFEAFAFERLLEIVTLDENARQAGRTRWQHYAMGGYSLTPHRV